MRIGCYVLLLTLVMCSAAFAVGPTNGGFESGDLTGWNQSVGAGVTFSASTSTPHLGSYDLECLGVDGSNRQISSDFFAVQPSTTYTVTVFVRTIGIPIALSELVQEYDASNAYTGTTHVLFNGTWGSQQTAWIPLKVSFTTGPTTTQLYWINSMNLNGGDEIFLDDFIVELGTLSNAGFEFGDYSNWVWAAAGNNHVITTTNPHSGTYCGGATAGAPTYNLDDLWYYNIPVEGGQKYYAEVWVRTAVPPTATAIDLEEYDSNGAYQGQSDYLFNGTWGGPIGWTRLSCNFTAKPNTAYANWITRFGLQGSQEMYVDDYFLIKVPPQTGPISNPGFELASLLGWTTGGSGVSFGVTTNSPHGGSYAAELDYINSSIGLLTQTCGVPASLDPALHINPNTDYKASVWVKVAGGPPIALDTHLDEYTSGGSYALKSDYVFNGTWGAGSEPTDWTELSTTFTTGPNTQKIYWYTAMNLANSSNKLFFDDFALTPVVAYGSIAEARAAGAGSIVDSGATETPASLVVTNIIEDPISGKKEFFVENEGRSSGALVESANAFMPGTPIAVGDVLSIHAQLSPALDGRFWDTLTLQPTKAVTKIGTHTPLLPIWTTLRPMLTQTGLPQDGLLMQFTGKVSGGDEIGGTFSIDDGSGSAVLVQTSYDYPFPADGQFATVTGYIVDFGGTKYIHVPYSGAVVVVAP